MPYKRAILAAAHKMLRGIVAMVCARPPYIDPGIDYEAQLLEHNASRLLGKLAQYGCLDRIRSGEEPSAI